MQYFVRRGPVEVHEVERMMSLGKWFIRSALKRSSGGRSQDRRQGPLANGPRGHCWLTGRGCGRLRPIFAVKLNPLPRGGLQWSGLVLSEQSTVSQRAERPARHQPSAGGCPNNAVTGRGPISCPPKTFSLALPPTPKASTTSPPPPPVNLLIPANSLIHKPHRRSLLPIRQDVCPRLRRHCQAGKRRTSPLSRAPDRAQAASSSAGIA